MSDVWNIEKKQLLIDSLVNTFDVPKFYFQEFFPPRSDIPGLAKTSFAVIDGKQRLSAIWEFLDGDFALSDGIEYLADPEVDLVGLTYSELKERYPKIAGGFESRPLAVMTISTDEPELIEEMFTRLNEAVPLSAAEKRNALRGPLPGHFRELVTERFFTRCLPFTNNRYRHLDLACKFMYLEYEDGPADLKKAYLDQFVVDFREQKRSTKAKELHDSVTGVLSHMASIFTAKDPLLRQIGTVTVYFALYQFLTAESNLDAVSRSDLERFEQLREANRVIAADAIAKADYQLLEYDRLSQSPNDGVALSYRLEVLKKHLGIVSSDGNN